MLHLYVMVMGFLDDRLERAERGDVVGWLSVAAMTVAVVVFAVPGVKNVVTKILDSIVNKIGDLT